MDYAFELAQISDLEQVYELIDRRWTAPPTIQSSIPITRGPVTASLGIASTACTTAPGGKSG